MLLKHNTSKSLTISGLQPTYLECPWLPSEPLLVSLNVGGCDVVSCEDDISPVAEEAGHPVHVSTGRVQQGYLVLAELLLQEVNNFV